MAAPKITVALPVFNGAATLREAIRSILWQTQEDFELLVVDDGSTDGSLNLAREFSDRRIRVMADGDRRGLAPRLNQAISLAAGRYFARMDQDDVSFPHRLQKQSEFLETHPEVDLVGTRAIVFKDDGTAIGMLPFSETHKEICSRPWAGLSLPHPTWMGRIEWFRRLRYREPEVIRGEDQELLLRAHSESCYACIPDLLFGYRRNAFPLRKSLPTRFRLAHMQAREHAAQHRWQYALLAIGLQMAKAGTDIAQAVLPGKAGRATRFLRAIDEADALAWERVWNEVQIDDAGMAR